MKMRRYNNSIPYINNNNDIYVQVTRKHAHNIFIATLYYALALLGTIAILALALNSKWYLLLLVLPLAFYREARSLEEFTKEARDILWYTNMRNDNNEGAIISEEKEHRVTGNTVLTGANGKTKHVIHVDLTQGQLQQIAQAALSTESLTVNFLESIGLSRQDAELLRVELTQYGILNMDKKGRTKLTRDGEKVFKRIVP